MKVIFTIFLFAFTNVFSCNHLNDIRWLLLNADKDNNLDKIEKLRQEDCVKAIPYHAVAKMRAAKDISSIFKKVRVFMEGKDILENYILNHPDDIEARYLRWMTQKNVPKILGYFHHLKEDYDYFFLHIEKSNINSDYKQAMTQKIKANE